jgi:hypothetical protein
MFAVNSKSLTIQKILSIIIVRYIVDALCDEGHVGTCVRPI